MYAVITENDESQWQDQTGIAYHFPKRALMLLKPGMEVVYYKGKQKNKKYAGTRLTPEMHYFGIAKIGKIYADPNSKKGDHFAVIDEFKPFIAPVLSKTANGFLEPIPGNRVTNYWRDGTRSISAETYRAIVNQGSIAYSQFASQKPFVLNDIEHTYESLYEGGSSKRFTTTYERNFRLREQAILIHGTNCVACGFSFERFYGEYAKGFIHIHHIHPVSTTKELVLVDPEKDLMPLCANCHSIVHRRKDKILSIGELKEMIYRQKSLDSK